MVLLVFNYVVAIIIIVVLLCYIMLLKLLWLNYVVKMLWLNYGRFFSFCILNRDQTMILEGARE